MNPLFFSSKSLEPQAQGKLSNGFYFLIRIAKPQELRSITEILTNSFYSRQGIMGWAYPFLRLGIYEDLLNRIRSKSGHYLCLVALVVRDAESTNMREQNLVGTVEISMRSRSGTNFLSHQQNLVLSPSGTDVLSLNPWPLDNFEYVYLSNLAVDSDYRRLGIAKQLLNCCEHTALEWGFCDLYLHVLENNDTARRLYDGAGYRLQEVEWTLGSLLFKQPRKLLLRKSFSGKT